LDFQGLHHALDEEGLKGVSSGNSSAVNGDKRESGATRKLEVLKLPNILLVESGSVGRCFRKNLEQMTRTLKARVSIHWELQERHISDAYSNSHGYGGGLGINMVSNNTNRGLLIKGENQG